MSELLKLRIAMAHRFRDRGANGNLPADHCLACGLPQWDKVHLQRYIKLQIREGSNTRLAIEAWPGPGAFPMNLEPMSAEEEEFHRRQGTIK
jgi:hypothetical protein